MLDKIIKVSSLTGGLLILLGYLKLKFYYDHFNVPIIQFISLSEIIMMSLDDINVIIIAFIIIFLQTFQIQKFDKVKIDNSDKTIETRRFEFMHAYRWKIAFGFCMFSAVLMLAVRYDLLRPRYSIIYLVAVLIVQGISALAVIKVEEKFALRNSTTILAIASGLVATMFLLAERDFWKVQCQKQIVVHTQDEVITCGTPSTNIYIGKTEKFIFIKIGSTNRTRTLQNDQVKGIEFDS